MLTINSDSWRVLLTTQLLILAACSGSADDNTGSISFTLKPLQKTGGMETARMDCGAIANIKATVYNNQGQAVASGGPWGCLAHSGAIEKIPAGSNRVVIAEALDGAGNTKMWAYKGGVVIENGKQTDLGEIAMADSGPMIYVQGGCFQMGDFVGDGQPDERPAHEVCLDGYFLDTYELSAKRAQSIGQGGRANCSTKDMDCPVRLTWDMGNNACAIVGKRLPTEAEWEYAARERGKNVKYATRGNNADCDSAATFGCKYTVVTHKDTPFMSIGTFPPTAMGFYEMTGNAAEWVADWYDTVYYSSSPKQNPKGPGSGSFRVSRGGSYLDEAVKARTTARNPYDPTLPDHGVRCAL